MNKLIILTLVFSACAFGAEPDVEQAECMIPVRAYCEAQTTCHANGFNLTRCLDDGALACETSEYRTNVETLADPWTCGDLQRALTCAPAGGTRNTPASAACLSDFWTF